MGGISSGRYRTTNRGAIEDVRRIDIRQLRRMGLIRPRIYRAGAFRWSRHGEESAPTSFLVDLTNLDCGALHVFFMRNGHSASQTVRIVAQPCQFGGNRFYFLCPVTGAFADVLVLDGMRFVSRKAARLTYSSQSETKLHRLYRARDKAEARACGDDGHPRPRGPNRERLLGRWKELEDATEDHLKAECLRRFGCAL